MSDSKALTEIRWLQESRKQTAWIVAAILAKDMPDDPEKMKDFEKSLNRKLQLIHQLARKLPDSMAG